MPVVAPVEHRLSGDFRPLEARPGPPGIPQIGGQGHSRLGALQGEQKAGQASVGWSGVVGVQGPYPNGHQLLLSHPSPHLWSLSQTYYGQVLKKSADLRPMPVTAARPVPQHIREALQNVHRKYP